MLTRPFLYIVWGNVMNQNTIDPKDDNGSPPDRYLISIRPARPDEADRIHSLVISSMQMYCKNAGITNDKLDVNSETADDVRAAIMSVPFFVAVNAGGVLVGSVRLLHKKISSFGIPALAGMLSLGPDEYVSYFSRFAVSEDQQGLGIGSLLYNAAKIKARELTNTYILLHTALSNPVMISFYEKRGFVLLSEDTSRGYPRGLLGKKL